ncbi:MAG: AzlD domain-containing protein [Robiginitomaculum sp.]|uniref:Branched-chain amino acid transport n=1 Tax=hydrothermal vent metagenome TaxID=652676 RepID=A0A3B0RKF4_9ZZZZ|nr:AzlD domain-containing protein [Robiginitomaculum sp.]
MTSSYWIFIGVLAIAAFSIRVTGLIAGNAIRKSRLAPLLNDLPGLIIVSLVAASMAGQPVMTWVAATVALGIAWKTNNVIVTMIVGVVTFAGLPLY